MVEGNMMDRSHNIAVAALDFGTTYSGYAFSLKSDFETDPLNIHINHYWNSGDRMLESLRVPTCVLLDKNKELKLFGYEAENTFADICLDGKRHDYYFFSDFFTEKNLRRDMVLVDATGKSLPACHVLKMFIKAFVNHLVENLKKNRTELSKAVIIWVIPVSKDLTDTSKQFLQSCTEKAGITSDHLMFVTDIEAAFIYCHHLPDRDQYQKLKDGTEYMIVHLGGCDAQITVLEKESNQVIEKYWTKCNDCGGTSVDNSFRKLIFQIFEARLMMLGKKSQFTLLHLNRKFEIFKRSDKEEDMHSITLAFPFDDIASFCDKHISEDNLFLSYHKSLDKAHNSMTISFRTCLQFFKPTIGNIINEMEKVLTCYKGAHNVKDIIMVGGFSESSLVQVAVRQKFPKKNIIVPENIGLGVVKGAVLCGYKSSQYLQMSSSKLHVFEKLPQQRGFLLLINFKFSDDMERKGSHEDVRKLFDFFSELGYAIDYRSDLTTKELKRCLENVKHTHLTIESEMYYCFICIIMSHGNKSGINTKDGIIKVDELIGPFKNDSASSFIGKPKIFMVQTCRGKKVQVKQKHVRPRSCFETDNADVVRMPTEADIIKIYATTPGYVSYRKVNSTLWTGSLFIQAFITVARQHLKNHLLEILTAVNYELSTNPEYELEGEKCQLSMYEIALSRLFYL